MFHTHNGVFMQDIRPSAGTVEKPTISYNVGEGTVTIGDGKYRFFTNAEYHGQIIEYEVSGATLAIDDDTTSYILAQYNNGTPQLAVTTNVTTVDDAINCVIYTVYRNGEEISVIDWDEPGLGLSNKIHRRLIETERFSRVSGLDLGETGTRNVTVASGKVWEGSYPNTLSAANSSTNETYLLTNNGDGTWANTLVTQYPNTQYDPATGTLATLTDGKYGVVWVYRSMSSTTRLYLLLGDQEYDLAEARVSNPVDVPTGISTNTMLIGRIIVLKNDATSTEIDNAFQTLFAPSAMNASAGSLLNMQTFTTNGTYTPTPGTTKALVYVTGGGGQGGGAKSGVYQSIGNGGGAGGTQVALYSIDESQTGTVVIGSGGSTGGAGANGQSGSNSTFTFNSITTTGNGGSGGTANNNSAANFYSSQTAGGTGSSGASSAYRIQGGHGEGAIYQTESDSGKSGHGGRSYYGYGGFSKVSNGSGTGSNGNTPDSTSYGAGGGGALQTNSNAYTGGSGKSGIVIIYEYV